MNPTAPIVREVPVGDTIYRYITEYHKNELDTILGRYHVVYEFKPSNGHWALELTADEQSMVKAGSDLLEFCMNLASHIGEDFISLPFNIDLEEFARLAGQRIAKPMQILVLPQAGTVCQIIGPSDQLAQAKERLLALAAEQVLPRNFDQAQGLDFSTPLGTRVSIFKGDLVRQQTEAIVNPANSKLQHYGGAAKAIAVAAGSRLIQEGEAFIRDHGRLRTSEAMHTSSGNLYPPIKYVVHTVGPSSDAYPDVNDQRRLLEATFFNCLSYANNKLNVSSISVPAISSGIHGISRHLVAEAAFAGLQEFERKQPRRSLLTINFVNIDDRSTDAFLEVFRRQMSQNARAKLHDGKPISCRDFHGAGFQQGLAVGIGTIKWGHASSANAPDSIQVNPVHGMTPTTVCAQQEGCGLPQGHRGAPVNSALEQIPAANAQEMSQWCETAPKAKKSEREDCVICMEPMMNPKELPCGHKFCEGCIKDSFERFQPKCPSCGRLFDVMRGNQPPGTMNVTTDFAYLPGYEQFDTLTIKYDIPDGIQNDTHPHPGQSYHGTRRTAYLPNNPEGKEVCDLLRKAFDAGLIFTVGRSVTSGKDDQVIWNDIHHKTHVKGAYGYPDPEYLSRVKEELKAKGIVPTPARFRCDLM